MSDTRTAYGGPLILKASLRSCRQKIHIHASPLRETFREEEISLLLLPERTSSGYRIQTTGMGQCPFLASHLAASFADCLLWPEDTKPRM